MAEERALCLRKRQNAADVVARLGDQVVAAMAENFLDDASPRGAMEERGVRRVVDEAIPARGISVAKRAHVKRRGIVDRRNRFGERRLHAAAPPRYTRSARLHEKSRRRHASLGAMRRRFT